jgi:hypothetical protein
MGRVWALGLVGVAGCFQPTYEAGAPCSPVTQSCPGDLKCIDGFCGGRTQEGDGNPPPPDGGDPDGSIDGAVPLGPWGMPTPVPGVNTGSTEEDATFSADRLQIVFMSNRDGNRDLYTGIRATATSDFVVGPMILLNSSAEEHSPELSPDGNTLYFASERDGGAGDHDIYMSVRTNGIFSTVTRVAELSQVGADEGDVAISPDGLTLIVARDNVFLRSTRAAAGDSWSAPAPIPNASFGSGEAAPSFDAAGNLYFHANANRDLFFAAKNGSTFDAPVPFTELNTNAREAAPFVSPDGRYMVFERNGQLLETTR